MCVVNNLKSKRKNAPNEILTLMNETEETLTLVAETLDIANEYGMAAEVVWSALTMAAEANEHGKTMEQVLEAALQEWDI
jgi:hypothetical protein